MRASTILPIFLLTAAASASSKWSIHFYKGHVCSAEIGTSMSGDKPSKCIKFPDGKESIGLHLSGQAVDVFEKDDCSDKPHRLDLAGGKKDEPFCVALTKDGEKNKAFKVRAFPSFGFDRS